MRRRDSVAAAGVFVALGATALACVDLFHSTDFETICTKSPDDPACMAGPAADGGDAVDAKADATDGAGAHPDFCAWTTAEARTQALRACAWLGACEGPVHDEKSESTFGRCVVHAQLAFDCAANPSLRPRGAVDDFWGCLASVNSCGDVDRCVFPGGVQPCNPVDGGSSTACGTGSNAGVRLECSGPGGRAAGVEPCVMRGQTCTTENGSLATCGGVEGLTCTTNRCASTAAVDCKLEGAPVDRGVDCAGYGEGRCVTSETGEPACAPGDQAKGCPDDAPVSCDGAVATSCIAGKETRVDCSLLGLPCDVSVAVGLHDPSAACVQRGATMCDATTDTCDGSLVASCGRGTLFEVNCLSVGLGKCKLDTSNRASCTAP